MRIGFASPFIPRELIEAHGLAAQRVVSSAGAGRCCTGRCLVAAGQDLLLAGRADEALDAFVLVTSCDQQRRCGAVTTLPCFRFNLPVTVSAHAARLYRQELERQSRFLCRLSGCDLDPAALFAAVLEHDARRQTLRRHCRTVGGRAAAEALALYAETGTVAVTRTGDQPGSGLPVALLGGPLSRADFVWYATAEAAGLCVALDGSETGERGLARDVDHDCAAADPLEALVRAYFLGIPDAFRRPDDALHEWLAQRITERGLRAVVLRHDPWCDLWRAQAPRLRQRHQVPVLAVDAGEEGGDLGRLACRLEALREMIA